MKKIFLILIYIFVFIGIVSAQKSKLAAEYYRNGEYEKSAALYKQLLIDSKYNDNYFTYYYMSLMNDERYEESIEAIDEQLKRKPQEIHLYVRKGYILERLGKESKAEKLYEKAIKNIGTQSYQVIKLANAFKDQNKIDLALETYEKAIEKVKDNQRFLLYIGDLYAEKSDIEKMINYYLAYLRNMQNRYNPQYIKSKLSRILSVEEMKGLRVKLIENIQEYPDKLPLIDLLSWVYLQLNEYDKARRQIIAIDKRFNENGSRVYNFAKDAIKANEYTCAAKSYQYIINNKENNSPFYMKSVSNYLNVTSEILMRDTSTTRNDLLEIEKQYQEFIDKFGVGNITANLIIELSELEALKLHDVDKAILILKDLIKRSYIDKTYIGKAKIQLGDFYLLRGEIWESSLLYSQVDKDFKEGELGELSRYKNAQLYYYNGDFEWAQIIFDILKPATSRMISNDAIESSVFISETIGEDSTMIEALKMFSKSELLIYQNRYNEALSSLDSINYLFPKNNLEDDVWYVKAHVFKSLKKYELAKKMYEQIIEKYPDELKADNALFELAQLNEEIFNDIENAKLLYEKLFLEYESSTLAIEARKKYRELNGENVL